MHFFTTLATLAIMLSIAVASPMVELAARSTWGNFLVSCQANGVLPTFSGSTLTAQCEVINANPKQTSIDINNCLGNSNGLLHSPG